MPVSHPSAALPSTVLASGRRGVFWVRRSSSPTAGEAMRTNPTGEISKAYVQDLVTTIRLRIDELLSRGAIIYICGDASGMAAGVRASLGD